MPVQTVIKTRRDTSANWTLTNPTLASGEMGLETDTTKFKFGDGTTAWASLGYATPDYTSSIQHSVKAGEALTKGQAVYVSSADGTNMIVSKASNAAEGTSSKTMGLISVSLSTNGAGNVVSEGLLAGLNTDAANAAGDPVWLGTGGNLIYGLANKPVAPAHLVFIGIVTRKHASQGEIFVKVQNGFELEELHNVLITSAADDDLVAWDSATSLWKNQTAAQAGLATASHTHAVGSITGLGTGVATFLATPSSANLASAVTNETGNGSLVFSDYPSLNYALLKSPREVTTVSATAATGTIVFEALTQADLYYTSNATANFTLNFRATSLVGLNAIMGIGETSTFVFRNTNGSTAYYPNTIQIDGTTVTPKWLGGTAPSAGNASAVDVYSFVITKTANATFTVFASVSKFA